MAFDPHRIRYFVQRIGNLIQKGETCRINLCFAKIKKHLIFKRKPGSLMGMGDLNILMPMTSTTVRTSINTTPRPATQLTQRLNTCANLSRRSIITANCYKRATIPGRASRPSSLAGENSL